MIVWYTTYSSRQIYWYEKSISTQEKNQSNFVSIKWRKPMVFDKSSAIYFIRYISYSVYPGNFKIKNSSAIMYDTCLYL